MDSLMQFLILSQHCGPSRKNLPLLNMIVRILSRRDTFFSRNVSIPQLNDTVTESGRNFFQSSLFRLTK